MIAIFLLAGLILWATGHMMRVFAATAYRMTLVQ
jgi:hypothetical protein